jgi:hypothetical protein
MVARKTGSRAPKTVAQPVVAPAAPPAEEPVVVNSPAENVNPPLDDEDRQLSLEEAMALADAAMPVVAAAPAELPQTSREEEQRELEAQVQAEKEAALAAEQALAEAKAAEEAAPPPKPTHVRVMITKCAQDGVFPVNLNGKKHLLQRGIAKRIPVEVLSVLDDSDVQYEIVE